MNEQERLNKIHSKYKTPDENIKLLFSSKLGQEVTKLERLIKGYDNEVYVVTTRNHNEYIVRINQGGDTTFLNEAWGIEKAKDAGVPVPEIVFIGKIESSTGLRDVMIQEKLDGVPLSNVYQTLATKKRRDVLKQAGQILSKLHTIKLNGFYKRHDDGMFDFPNVTAYVANSIKDRTGDLHTLVNERLISSKQADLLISRVKEYYSSDFFDEAPVLLHGDYLPEHIFVNNELEIVGIIDFGEFKGGVAIEDFALTSFEADLEIAKMMYAGYPKKWGSEKDFLEILHLARIPLMIGYATHYLISENHTKQEAVDVISQLTD